MFFRVVDSFKTYGATAKQVACGALNTYILTTDGEILACGSGEYGRLGTGSSADELVPVTIESLVSEDIVQIAAGHSHALARTADGKIYCWGRNDMGQLGLEDSFIDIYSMEDMPRVVPSNYFASESDSKSQDGSSKIVKIAAGWGRSAAITSDGRVYVWGHRVSHIPKLVPMPNSVRATDVACGGEISKACVLIKSEDGNIWSMGFDSCHSLGIEKKPETAEVVSIRAKLGDSSVVDHSVIPRVIIDPFYPDFKISKLSAGFGGHAAALAVGRH